MEVFKALNINRNAFKTEEIFSTSRALANVQELKSNTLALPSYTGVYEQAAILRHPWNVSISNRMSLPRFCRVTVYLLYSYLDRTTEIIAIFLGLQIFNPPMQSPKVFFRVM